VREMNIRGCRLRMEGSGQRTLMIPDQICQQIRTHAGQEEWSTPEKVIDSVYETYLGTAPEFTGRSSSGYVISVNGAKDREVDQLVERILMRQHQRQHTKIPR
jgi:hypothetical protein